MLKSTVKEDLRIEFSIQSKIDEEVLKIRELIDNKTPKADYENGKFYDRNNKTDCDSQNSQLSFSGGDIENYYKNNKKRMLKLDAKKANDEVVVEKPKKSKKKKSGNQTPVLITIK